MGSRKQEGGRTVERMEYLWPGGPVFFYDDSLFKPSTDAFLLGYFARPRAGESVCDLGAGTGLIGLLLLAREPLLSLHNVEIQPTALLLAVRTARANGLGVSQHLADLRHLESILAAGSMDYVVSNPPYFSAGSGGIPSTPSRRTARTEDVCTLEDVCAAAARLLRWGGRFALVYRPERLCDLMVVLRQCGLEPKRLRLVQHTASAAPSLVLLESRRGGRPSLTVEPPLVLRDAEGRETPEVQAAYFRCISKEKGE